MRRLVLFTAALLTTATAVASGNGTWDPDIIRLWDPATLQWAYDNDPAARDHQQILDEVTPPPVESWCETGIDPDQATCDHWRGQMDLFVVELFDITLEAVQNGEVDLTPYPQACPSTCTYGGQ